MKIPGIGPGDIPQIRKTAPARKAEAPQVASTKDTVDVGADALLVSRLRSKLTEAVRPNPRVEELRQQVEQGTYQPDPGELARILFGLEPPVR